MTEYPHIGFLNKGLGGRVAYFTGSLQRHVCWGDTVVVGQSCVERYKATCIGTGVYLLEVIPGEPGCVGGDNARYNLFSVRFEDEYSPPEDIPSSSDVIDPPLIDVSYSSESLDDGQVLRYEVMSGSSGNSGAFTIPDGARSFQLVTYGSRLTALVDPNGKDYVEAFANDAGPAPVRILRSHTVALTQATSDVNYGYADVLVPGEWAFRVEGDIDSQAPLGLLVVKTRNDSDDRLRLKVVNATTHANQTFTPRLDRLVDLAAHLGINLEVSGIEKIPHRSDPHAPPSDFCERFCSSDEAVVYITEPGGWSSPGVGIALKVDYNTHFLVGAEVATSDNDHYITAVLHELLHYAAGLGHLFETHKDGSVDADDLQSTGVHNEVVAPTTKIAGGVNHERLWERGELLWDDNIMIGWRMTHDEPDVDGFGETDENGRRRTLVTFLEHHQLEWLKNSPFYW